MLVINYFHLWNLAFVPFIEILLFKLVTQKLSLAKEIYYKRYQKSHKYQKTTQLATINFVVDRDKIFIQGLTVELFAKCRAALLIKFLDDIEFCEIGEGLTTEFFKLMPEEFCKKNHQLWMMDKGLVRDDENKKEF